MQHNWRPSPRAPAEACSAWSPCPVPHIPKGPSTFGAWCRIPGCGSCACGRQPGAGIAPWPSWWQNWATAVLAKGGGFHTPPIGAAHTCGKERVVRTKGVMRKLNCSSLCKQFRHAEIQIQMLSWFFGCFFCSKGMWHQPVEPGSIQCFSVIPQFCSPLRTAPVKIVLASLGGNVASDNLQGCLAVI